MKINLPTPTESASRTFFAFLSPLMVACALTFMAGATASAATVVTKNSSVTVFSDGYGFNTRFPDTAEPWEFDSNFWTLAYGDTFASCLRYPGGTVGSFWNGQTDKLLSKKLSADPNGWIDTAKVGFTDITDVVSGGTQKINSLPDLKTVVTATGATPLFVLNLVTPGKDFYASAQGWNRTVNDHPGIAYNASNPDDWYKLLDARYTRTKQILIKANAQGIPITRIELGNEYYLANSEYYKEAFPDDSVYATAGQCYAIAANYIANKLLSDPQLSFLPANVSISVPGAAEKVSFSSARILSWNSQMTGTLNSSVIKNVTLHSYQEADTNITTFNATNVKTNIATWLANIDQTLQDKNAYTTIVNASTPYNVWWNELSPTQAAGVKAQWGGVLAKVFMGLWAADNKGVVFMHPNLDGPYVVDPATGTLNQIGWGMIPLMRASSSCTKAFHLNFPGLPKLGTSVRTVLQGQYFENSNGSTRKCCIVSFSDVAYTLDLTGVFTGLGTLTISGQRNTTPDLTTIPIHVGDSTVATSSVVIQPYSVNFIRP